MDSIFWLKDINPASKDLVGSKALGVAALYNLKMPVPEAFVISAEVFDQFFGKIRGEIDGILLGITDEGSLKSAANQIRQLILNTDFPGTAQLEITEAYKKLDAVLDSIPMSFEFIRANHDPLFVAVRSSSTEYFPEQQATSLGVRGITELIQAVKNCWASLFTIQAIAYRKKNGLPEPKMAVLVQKMANATRSGRIFTNDPLSADPNKLLIEVEYGFSKKADPSQYLFDKSSMAALSAKIRRQTSYFAREGDGKISRQPIPQHVAGINPLPELDAKSLIIMAKKIEEHFGSPQLIEWVSEGKKLFLVQTQQLRIESPLAREALPAGETALRGLVVFPGVANGTVRVINSKEDADSFPEDSILVTDATNPYLFLAADKAKAIITGGGGLASHAVQLCRELEKPCIIGVENATQVLQSGDEVSIDENGFIYRKAADKPGTENLDFNIGNIGGLLGSSGAGVSNMDIPPADLSQIFGVVSDVEKQVTELVYRDAEKRRNGDAEDEKYSKLLSDIEWDIRQVRKKLQNCLRKD